MADIIITFEETNGILFKVTRQDLGPRKEALEKMYVEKKQEYSIINEEIERFTNNIAVWEKEKLSIEDWFATFEGEIIPTK